MAQAKSKSSVKVKVQKFGTALSLGDLPLHSLCIHTVGSLTKKLIT